MLCRKTFVLLLLALFIAEILPFCYREPPLMAPDEAAGPAFRFEPLQVCDQGDPFLGSVAGIPFLGAVAPTVVLVPELFRIAPEAGFPLPDGFDPLLDRPPQPSA